MGGREREGEERVATRHLQVINRLEQVDTHRERGGGEREKEKVERKTVQIWRDRGV